MRSALLLLAGLLVAGASVRAADPRPPNIVLIFIDDMGYADIGPFGNKRLRTPNLDRMAREGMRFTSFYATPVCSMSRAALLTGCYNARVGIPGVLFPKDNVGLNTSEITLAKLVKSRGYATMMIGKWHLGHHPEFLPTHHGFDHYFGLPYSNDMKLPRPGFPPLPLYRDDKVLETEPDQSQLTRRYTEEAVGFIRAQKDRPFFLYLPHTMIHAPLAASEAFRGKSTDGLLGDAVEEIDWSVGRVLETIKELGLDENTLVIFTSDNGPAGRDAPPFSGSKGSSLEGGVREPCIMRWPGRIPAGTTCERIAGNIDLLPTFAGLTGAAMPTDRVIDGRDLGPLLRDPDGRPARDTHLYYNGFRLEAIRQGDWKYFPKTPARSKKEKAPKDSSGPALYDLAHDPAELHNLADEHPAIVERLARELRERGAEVEAHKRAPGMHVAAATTATPAATTPAAAPDLSKLKPGDALAKTAAPQIGGRAFTYSLTVETAQSEAVILAHGGQSQGYALFLRDGRAVFSVRHAADRDTEVVSAEKIGDRPVRLTASLAADGRLSLKVGDLPAVTAKSSGPLKQPAEEFCIGHDSLKPAARYGRPEPFQGRLSELSLRFD